MNSNAIVDFRNPLAIRKAGMFALKKELGTVGTTYFMRQFGAGHGDYTAEHEKLLADITLDEIAKNVRELARQPF